MGKTSVELMIQKVLGQLVSQKGQEIYFVSGQKPMMRKNGYLFDMEIGSVVTENNIKNMADIIFSDKEIEQLSSDKSIVRVKEIGSMGRFMIKCYFQRKSLSMVFRSIPVNIPKFEDMALPESVKNIVNLKKGLVVISGPYDSGKSTLIASILQYMLYQQNIRVMTIEKPLEYILTGGKGLVEQREVGVDVDSYLQGVNMLFEEDVDVVYVSSVDSPETLSKIISLASVKLVFLHIFSDSAVEALENLVSIAEEFGADSSFAYKLSKQLKICLNLRLPPTVGRTGRMYAFEILINTSPVKIALKEKDFDRVENILQLSSKDGMKTLDQHLFELVEEGKIDKKDSIHYLKNQDKFKNLLV